MVITQRYSLTITAKAQIHKKFKEKKFHLVFGQNCDVLTLHTRVRMNYFKIQNLCKENIL